MKELLLLLAVFHEDVDSERLGAHRTEIAQAVTAESVRGPLPKKQWAALLLTVGWHESRFSIRISDGGCKPWECDRGKARGMWQLHRNAHNREQWVEQHGDVALQVRLASDMLRRAYFTCASSGVESVRGTLNAYAGQRCGADRPSLRARLATYARLTR